MAAYYTNELAFELPALPWVDDTVTTLSTDLGEGRSATFIVHREPLPAGTTLRKAVADDLRRADLRQPGHEVIFQREREIASRPAFEHAARWRGPESMVYTRQAHLEHGGVRLVFGASAWLEDRARCDELLDHLLDTLQLRDDVSASR